MDATPQETTDFSGIAREGLWTNNPALVQMLGLCPLLAVSSSVVNATGLALATLIVLVGSNTSVSLLRGFLPPAARLPAFVLIIASYTTCVTLLMQAFAFELYLTVALFVQIIVTNCTILGRAESFASRQPVLASAWDGLMMALGFAAVLIGLGAFRELLGTGMLLADMDQLFGPAAADWTLTLIPEYRGFLLAVLPPGAFIGLGLLIAAKQYWEGRR
ncbi:MAG: electron transport complex subunit E [Gammaproteobacteria bacterium]|nr:electron transport complex subunit E [Gammaproteobacteria bacterium]